MKLVAAVLTFFLATLAAVDAQVTYNNGTFSCFPGGGAYCAGDSMGTNIIIRCNDKVGQPGNCNDNLAGAPPIGVKSFAPCYESSPTAGDAACSWNCTAYPDNGLPFILPRNLSAICLISGTPPTVPANLTTQVNGTNLVISEPMTTLSMTSSPPSSTAAYSASTSQANAAASSSSGMMAAISAMTAAGVPLGAAPSSGSDLGPLFSSLIAGAGNATVSAISATTTTSSIQSSTTATSSIQSSTTTTTTTLPDVTVQLITPSGASATVNDTGSSDSTSSSPAFTGAATQNKARHMSALGALIVIPALLFL